MLLHCGHNLPLRALLCAGKYLLPPLQVLCLKVSVWVKFTIAIKINELCAAAHMQAHFVVLCWNVGCWIWLGAAFGENGSPSLGLLVSPHKQGTPQLAGWEQRFQRLKCAPVSSTVPKRAHGGWGRGWRGTRHCTAAGWVAAWSDKGMERSGDLWARMDVTAVVQDCSSRGWAVPGEPALLQMGIPPSLSSAVLAQPPTLTA